MSTLTRVYYVGFSDKMWILCEGVLTFIPHPFSAPGWTCLPAMPAPAHENLVERVIIVKSVNTSFENVLSSEVEHMNCLLRRRREIRRRGGLTTSKAMINILSPLRAAYNACMHAKITCCGIASAYHTQIQDNLARDVGVNIRWGEHLVGSCHRIMLGVG